MTASTRYCSAESCDHAIVRQLGLATWLIGSTLTDTVAADDGDAGHRR